MMKKFLILFAALLSSAAVYSQSEKSTISSFSTTKIEEGVVTGTNVNKVNQDLLKSLDGSLITETSGTNSYVGAPFGITSYTNKWKVTVRIPNTSTNLATINFNSLGTKKIFKSPAVQAGAGDLVQNQDYQMAYNTALDGGAGAFLLIGGGGGSSDPADIDLPSVVALVNVGGIAPGYDTDGKSLVEFITDLIHPYIQPVFTSFSVTGQATTVEVGTTLSGSKTFTWAITQNSGVVSTIDIYDITGSTSLVTTPNDGSQAQTVTTRQLNSNGATQQWRGVGNNSSPAGTFNSSTFTVTGRFFRFFGPTASSPANSAAVRGLPSSAFYTGGTTFTLATGNTQTKFVVALPPGVNITSVVDTSALNADITSEYVLTGTINVQDAGGTNRSYNIYEMNIGVAYGASHNHSITIN